jgi:hypothetical protein
MQGTPEGEPKRLADPRGAGRDWPVSNDMSSRTGSVNFFKKNYFQTFKIFERHPTEYGDYDRCSNAVPPKRVRKVATLRW